MQQLFVTGGGLDGVAEGVAEVERHAQAGLFFVLGDDLGFDADAGGDDRGERGWVAGEEGVGVLLHEAEELGVGDDAGLDGLLQAGAEFGGRQGGERGRVGEDGEGVVEAADEVLAHLEVGAGLAADGGVDLGEQRGGELHITDAAHVDGGEEAGEVAEDAAAEGEQDGVAIGTGEGQLVGKGLDAGEALVGFAGPEKEHGGASVGVEGLEDGLRPEAPDRGRGDQEEARQRCGGLDPQQLAQARLEGEEKVGADGDIVGGGGRGDGDRGGFGRLGRHDNTMVSHGFAGGGKSSMEGWNGLVFWLSEAESLV